MTRLITNEPRSICILRLSALGDATHILPVVHTLRARYPDVKITWIVGRFEYKLVGALPGVEFLPYDKKGGLSSWRALRKQLQGRCFDALLLMQLSARAHFVSTAVKARRRIGFDARRSKEGHGMFVNERIQPAGGGHVLDGLMQFAAALDAKDFCYNWDLPTAPEDVAWAQQRVPSEQAFAVISPCSSHPLRNWHATGYARLAEHITQKHGLQVVLCGGPSARERDMADAIVDASKTPLLNLTGQDTLPRFLAVLRRARVLVSPDSGPAHIACVADTPVLGLYAATDPQRSGPYLWKNDCVNAYEQAAMVFEKRPAHALKWGMKIERPGVMDLLQIEDVIAGFDRLMAATAQ